LVVGESIGKKLLERIKKLYNIKKENTIYALERREKRDERPK